MKESIYPKVANQYVLTKEGHLYDLESFDKPRLIDKDVRNFISDWNTVVYLTRLGDVKVANDKKLESHFAGFFDGVELGRKKETRGAYYICDDKGQWYAFGNNSREEIEESKETVIHRFEKQAYDIHYTSASHDSIGRYGNYSRTVPIDVIKETREYRIYAKEYGEDNLKIEFSLDPKMDFIEKLARNETSGWDGPDVHRSVECDVRIELLNNYIYKPLPVDGEGIIRLDSMFGHNLEHEYTTDNIARTIKYSYTTLFNKWKNVHFYLEDDQRLYLSKLDNRGIVTSKQLLMEDVVAIYRNGQSIYITTVNGIQQHKIDRLARGEKNAIWTSK